jgi:hypothetical protein
MPEWDNRDEPSAIGLRLPTSHDSLRMELVYIKAIHTHLQEARSR